MKTLAAAVLLFVAVVLVVSAAYASVTITTTTKVRYDVSTGIRPDVLFCVDHICDHLSPAEARQVASALVNAADEQDAKE